MRALYRAALDSRACPASGNVVGLDDDDPRRVACSVCGRPLQLRARRERGGALVARIAQHRRADQRGQQRARRVELQAFAKAKLAEHKAKVALRAKKTRAAAAAARDLDRAIASVRSLPASETRTRRLRALERRAARVAVQATAARIPKLPRSAEAIVAELVRGAGLDLGTVEPDTWTDHLRGALPAAAVKRLQKLRPTEQVRAGLIALVKAARPRDWRDLETKRFAGQAGVLAFAQEFPGLARLRLPDRIRDAITAHLEAEAYDYAARQGQEEQVPF